jgi:tripartite-type tricarboxylate transporter receptor subunit TctC
VKRQTLVTLVLAVLAGASAIPAVRAQPDYPTRDIEIVVPYAPGGPVDTATRLIQAELSRQLGGTVVVTNKGGAGGALAMYAVAKAKPDGYTLAGSANATLVTVPATQANVAYTLADFAAIGGFATDYQSIISRAQAPWKTIEELIEHARKNPGKLTYGSPGVGSISHFNMEMLKMKLGIDIVHVPFTGTGPVKNAILGGHVDVGASAMGALLPLVRTGALSLLVSTAPKRLAEFPSVPTMAEKGLVDTSLSTVMQLYAPAKTPPPVVDKLVRALERTMRDRAVLGAIEKAGLIPDYRGPEATRKEIEADAAAVAAVVKKLGMTPQN